MSGKARFASKSLVAAPKQVSTVAAAPRGSDRRAIEARKHAAFDHATLSSLPLCGGSLAAALRPPMLVAPPTFHHPARAAVIQRNPDGPGSAAAPLAKNAWQGVRVDHGSVMPERAPSSTAQAPPVVRQVLAGPGQRLDLQTESWLRARLAGVPVQHAQSTEAREHQADELASIAVRQDTPHPVGDSRKAGSGFDLSRVRIHTSSEAARSATALGARAYSAGRHIVFAAGEFDPSSARGRELLVHELVHVAQTWSVGDAATQPIYRKEAPLNPTEKDPQKQEMLRYEDPDELARARALYQQILAKGINLDSNAGQQLYQGLINKNFPPPPPGSSQLTAPAPKINKTDWTVDELQAIVDALQQFTDPLHTQAKTGATQLATISRVNQLPNTRNTSLDMRVAGASLHDNISFANAWGDADNEFDKPAEVLRGRAIHELGHAFLKRFESTYKQSLAYWSAFSSAPTTAQCLAYELRTRSDASLPKLELPISEYGQTDPGEDLAEAARMYFSSRDAMRAQYPQRYALIDSFMRILHNEWSAARGPVGSPPGSGGP